LIKSLTKVVEIVIIIPHIKIIERIISKIPKDIATSRGILIAISIIKLDPETK
jgi:hypothetical protein